MNSKKDRLLKVAEVAERLNVDPRTVYRYIAQGHFRTVKFGGCRRILESSFEDFISRMIDLAAVENIF